LSSCHLVTFSRSRFNPFFSHMLHFRRCFVDTALVSSLQ
jgi:hypothetical protein